MGASRRRRRSKMLCVIRTSVGPDDLDAPGVALAYKRLAAVERDFRMLKKSELEVRPFHTTGRTGCAATSSCACSRPTCAGTSDEPAHRCSSGTRHLLRGPMRWHRWDAPRGRAPRGASTGPRTVRRSTGSQPARKPRHPHPQPDGPGRGRRAIGVRHPRRGQTLPGARHGPGGSPARVARARQAGTPIRAQTRSGGARSPG